MNHIKALVDTKKVLFTLLLAGASCSAWSDECGHLIDKMADIGELKTVLHCLDNKASSNTTRSPRPFQQSPTQAKLKLEGYEFEVEHCLRRAKALTCSVIITNKNKTLMAPSLKEFGIYTAASHFFDEYGKEYNASQTQMGNVVVDADSPSNLKRQHDGYLAKYMPLSIPMRTTITFADIDDKATTVLALNIKFSYRDRKKELSDKYVTLKSIGIGFGG